MRTQADLDAFYSSGSYWHQNQGGPELHAHQAVQARVRLDFVRAFCRSDGSLRILDVGAGNALIADELARISRATHFRYVGIEPDRSVREAAANRLRDARIEASFAQDLAEAGEGFDVIFLNHVLEHVEDPVGFLRRLSGRLNHDGILYVEVPNQDFRFKSDVFPHVQFFSPKSLRKVAECVNCEVMVVEAFGRVQAVGANEGFLERLHRAFWVRVFGYAAKSGLGRVANLANRALYGYQPSPAGLWVRAILRPGRGVARE